jgi:MATE family multidrug resistance protein
LAVPLFLANLTAPLLGVVDTAVVGHLGSPVPIGAVAIGTVVFSFLFWGFSFLRMATTGLTAQALGAQDAAAVGAQLLRPALLGIAAGLALVALQWPIEQLALALMPASDAVEASAAGYIAWRIWSAPAVLANLALAGWFIGIQRTDALLAQQIAINGANILLDLWFVLGLGWGVDGVAAATVAAELIGLAVAAALARRHWRRLGVAGAAALVRRIGDWLRLFSANFDILVRTACVTTAMGLFTAYGAREGDVVLAANAVLRQFLLIAAFGLDAFAQVAETFVGHAIGRRDRAQLDRAVWLSGLWAMACAVLFSLAFLALWPWLMALLTGVAAVRETAAAYVWWAVAAPLVAVASFQLDGVFIGATRTADMRNMMLLSFVGFVAVLHLAPPLIGNHGLWLAMMVFFGVRALTLAWRYPALARLAGGPRERTPTKLRSTETAMKKQRITSPHVPEPPAETWSNCLVIGDHIHIAGLTARGLAEDLGSTTVYAQAKEIFTRIRHLIEAAGSRMDDIVRVQIYVTDIRQREEVWQARREFFTGDFPVSTLVEVSQLADAGMKVEIDAVAIKGAGG